MAKNQVLELKRPARPQRTIRTHAPVARLQWKPQLLRSQESVAYEPCVVPVYWDAHFKKTPADVAAFDEFLRALFCSSWMTALADFGVAPARLLRSFVPDDAPRARLSQPQLEQQLTRWLKTEPSLQAPNRAERSLVYLVITPLSTQLTLGNLTSPQDFSGYHDCTPFSRTSQSRSLASEEDELFYAAVPLTVTGRAILDAHSRIISKELAESFIDRGHWLAELERVPAARRRATRVAV